MSPILIIEDDLDIAEAMNALMIDEKYDVRIALTGVQGIQLAQERIPELIMLDWQMPKMSGEEVLLQISKIDSLKNVPIILMSANIALIPPEILKLHNFISKPFDLDLLIKKVAEVIQR